MLRSARPQGAADLNGSAMPPTPNPDDVYIVDVKTIFAGERFPEPLPGAAAGSAGQLWAAPGSAGRLRVASAGSGELRLTIFSISQGVGGMAEPFKSAAPLSVLRRVKSMCFNILESNIPDLTTLGGTAPDHLLKDVRPC